MEHEMETARAVGPKPNPKPTSNNQGLSLRVRVQDLAAIPALLTRCCLTVSESGGESYRV